MGNVTAVIHATGAHHIGLASDIEQVFARFVDELKAFGHTVEHAAVTVGSRETVPAAAPTVASVTAQAATLPSAAPPAAPTAPAPAAPAPAAAAPAAPPAPAAPAPAPAAPAAQVEGTSN